MKVSGQFQNISNAEYYASIRSYIETCYRNNVNGHEALIRLIQDNPYTLEEILEKGKERVKKSDWFRSFGRTLLWIVTFEGLSSIFF